MNKNSLIDSQLRIEHDIWQCHAETFLEDGMAYTIILHDDSRITDAVFHYCYLTGQHYFAVGAGIYPIEKVYSHSMRGHTPSPTLQPAQETCTDPDALVISDESAEVIDIFLSPRTHPITFQRRVKCLMLSGLSQAEAEHIVCSEPTQLELFYDIGLGIFAIDAEAVSNTPLFNPYTGKQIPESSN